MPKNLTLKPRHILTARQEKFANLLFQGFTQRDAWIKAGYSSKYALYMVDVHASRLAHKAKIELRLQQLQDKVAKSSVATRQQKQEILKGIMQSNEAKHRDKISAIDIDNKMTGDYAPEKHLNLNVGFTTEDIFRAYREAQKQLKEGTDDTQTTYEEAQESNRA